MAGNRKSGGTNVALTTRKRKSGGSMVDLTIAKRRTGGVWVDLFAVPLSVSVSPSVIGGAYPNGTENFGLTATGAGGSGGYTYAWAIVSGGAGASLSPTTGASTTLSVTGTDTTRMGTVRCTVTDSSAATATDDVAYDIQFGTPP